MAIVSTKHTATTVISEIVRPATTDPGPVVCVISDEGGIDAIIGGPDLTATSGGKKISASGGVYETPPLSATDIIYCITATSTTDLDILWVNS